jgi:hypothetical protein
MTDRLAREVTSSKKTLISSVDTLLNFMCLFVVILYQNYSTPKYINIEKIKIV